MSDNTKAQSAIDKIDLILEKMISLEQLFEKKMKVLDNDIKLLNNKLNKLQLKEPAKILAAPTATAPLQVSETKVAEINIVNDLTKIFGRIKNKNKQPIEGVIVRLFTPSGEVVKTRTTDANGYWEVRIAAGQYGVEYDPTSINKRLSPVNMTVQINPGMKEYEIKGK